MMTRRNAIKAAAVAPGAALADNTPVAEVIRRQGAAAVWASIQRLARENSNSNAAGWLLLARRAAFAECLIDTCHDLGLRTVGQVEAFVARCGYSYAEVQGLFPTIEAFTGKQVDMLQLQFHAASQFSLARRSTGDPGDYHVEHNDRKYVAIPPDAAARMAATFPYRSVELWRSDDCEDTVTLMRAWPVQQGHTSLAIGLCGLYMYLGARFSHGHAVPFVFTTDDRFLLMDAGKVYPANFARFAGNERATSTKLARLYL